MQYLVVKRGSGGSLLPTLRRRAGYREKPLVRVPETHPLRLSLRDRRRGQRKPTPCYRASQRRANSLGFNTGIAIWPPAFSNPASEVTNGA